MTMTTYVFSWDGKESWPLMPDTEFVIEDSLKRDSNGAVILKGSKPIKEYCVFMVNPSRVLSNRRLLVCVCETEERAIKEMRECVEAILCKDSGVGTPSPYGALTDAYARR